MNRIFPVTVKLTRDEHVAVTEFAKSQGIARGEWMRDVILRELCRGGFSDPLLAEIIGVRLLLVNVLRSLVAGQSIQPEVFDKLLDEIANAKYQLAETLTSERRK